MKVKGTRKEEYCKQVNAKRFGSASAGSEAPPKASRALVTINEHQTQVAKYHDRAEESKICRKF